MSHEDNMDQSAYVNSTERLAAQREKEGRWISYFWAAIGFACLFGILRFMI